MGDRRGLAECHLGDTIATSNVVVECTNAPCLSGTRLSFNPQGGGRGVPYLSSEPESQDNVRRAGFTVVI